LVLALVYQVVSEFDGAVGMEHGFFVLMNLTQQCADLHVCFALVLLHFQTQSWIVWVVEELLQIVALKVVQAGLQTDRTFFKNA
jgi:hypothetical protein